MGEIWRHHLAVCPACGDTHALSFLSVDGTPPPLRIRFICPQSWRNALLTPVDWVQASRADNVDGVEVVRA